MILFITNKEDITTDFVVKRIRESGSDYYRFNTEDIFSNIDIDLDINKNKFQLFDLNKGIIDLENIVSVYFRRPKLPEIPIELNTGERHFLMNEYNTLVNGIYCFLSNKFWINNIHSIIRAENKISQLMLAQKIGFRIPETKISNISDNACDFIKRNSFDCIIKPMRSGFIDDPEKPRVIFTSKINKSITNQLDRLKFGPSILQKKIDKAADIRVTVVGDELFSARIDSQEHKDSEIDWRRGSNIIQHQHIKLPSDISIKCIDLVKQLNLVFGAIDLILDRKGNFYFLEINPNGQWAWIEKRLGLPISNEISKRLLLGM